MASRVQNLDTIVRSSDREYPVVNLKATTGSFLLLLLLFIIFHFEILDLILEFEILQGEVLFRTWNEIFSGQGGAFASRHHDIYSFNNRQVLNDVGWPQKIMWHGSHANGERNMESYCDAWTSREPNSIGLASSLMNHKILAQEKFSCQNQFIVLCIEAMAGNHASRHKRQVDLQTEQEYQELLESFNWFF